MLGALGLMKLAGAAACAYGAAAIWKQLPEPMMRAKMRICFGAAELYLSKKRKKGESRTYPDIHRVSILSDRIHVIFSLPLGLDPSKVRKAEWAFRQMFGVNAALDGDDKRFTLTVYSGWIEPFDYEAKEVDQAIKGLHLPIYVGRSRSGHVAYDMAEHPHLLVSGETGSGKSVWLRSCLTTLVRTLPPERLHLYLADLKLSEFHLFDGLPHVKMNEWQPVKLLAALKRLQHEMTERGKLCKKHGVANVMELPEEARPPFIVICIDEVALLRDNGDVMDAILQIGAIGRSNGVFLILSMQRPDAKLLDSSLKQCLTVRLSFRQFDEINSRIAVDVPDAAAIKASEKGRMVFRLDGAKPAQAAYLDMKRARKLLDPLRVAQIEPGSDEAIDIEGWEVLDDDAPGQGNPLEP